MRGRSLLTGIVWTYGAQLGTILLQFIYAAVSSRLVDPDGFGAYAIALSVSALISLIATGGISQAVSRMVILERQRLRGLILYAILLGVLAAIVTFASAPMWATLWGEQEATAPVQWLAISNLLAPLFGLCTSLVRRKGSFRALSLCTLSSNIVGMGLGVVAIYHFRDASALVASPIIAQIGGLVAAVILSGRDAWGIASIRHAKEDLRFSQRMAPVRFAEYLIGNITKLGTSRWLGGATLGQWNRGDVLTSLPFHQIQTALLQVIYPEFRHDVADSHRAFKVWTDMLLLVAWFAMPLSVAAAVITPFLVPLLFGPGWEIASILVVPLAIAAGLQMVTTVLSSAIEILGKFRWIWVTAAVLICVQLVGAWALFFLRDLSIAMTCLIATHVVRHAVQVYFCNRSGYLDGRRLLIGYVGVSLFSVLVASVIWVLAELVVLAMATSSLWLAAIALVLCVGWAARRWASALPPVKLAREYGFGKRSK